jgi:hypothetical protein
MSFARRMAMVTGGLLILAHLLPGAIGAARAASIAELLAPDGAVTATPTATPLPRMQIGLPGLCAGDCNGDGVVTVNEVVLGVAIALNVQPANACQNVDADRDGRVVVAELVGAVAHLLRGCGPQPTATATPPGTESVCGGPVTSAPKLCNLQISPTRVRRNSSINLSFGVSDLEGDLTMLCAGTGAADAGTPPLQCTSAQPAGMLVNVAGTLGPFPVTLPIGRYVFALQFRDAAGHTSEVLTAPFEVFQLRM